MTFAIRYAAAILACAAMVAPAAHAQIKEPQVPAQTETPKLDPKACSDRDRLAEGDVVENEGRAPRDNESLSDKLARTDGVICPPPGLDPDIRAPAPGGGAIQVIPPPSSLRGDPDVRPK